MKTLSFWKKSVYSGLVFFGTVVVLSVGYAVWNSTMSTVTSGNPLTAGGWNALVDNISDLNSRWSRVGGNIVFTGGNVGIGTNSLLQSKFSVDGGDGTTSYIVAQLSNKTSGYGTFMQFTDALTYNYAIGTAPTSGDFTFIAGRFPGTAGTERMRITQNGNVYMGTQYAGSVAGGNQFLNDPAGAYQIIWHPSTATSGHSYSIYQWNGVSIGNIAQNGTTGVSYNTTSNRRLKENFVKPTESLEKLDKINVYNYNYKSDAQKTQQMGFIAQELYDIYPQAVTVGGDDPKTHPWMVDYSKVIPLLTSAVKELSHKIDELFTKYIDQQKEVDSLKVRLDALEQR